MKEQAMSPKRRKPDCESLAETTRHKDSMAYRNEAYPGGLGSKTVDTEALDAPKRGK